MLYDINIYIYIFFFFHMESLKEELGQILGYLLVLRHYYFGFDPSNKEGIWIEIKLDNF